MGAVVALDTLFNGGRVWKGAARCATVQRAPHRAGGVGRGVAQRRLAGGGVE